MRTLRCASVLVAITALLVVETSVSTHQAEYPVVIPFPAGFGPEGIEVGNGHTFYVGSLTPPTVGQILVGDLRTGALWELIPPTGRPALGIKHDSRGNLLFVAGGTSGRGTVYDVTTADQMTFYQFQSPGVTVINDVVITRSAAYFTDSQLPFLYGVELGPAGHPVEGFTAIPLPSNFGVSGACRIGPSMKGNGIAADPSGEHLVIVHMSEGRLYRVDLATFAVVAMDIQGSDSAGGGDVCTADGLLLDGNRLYVVQNFLNRVAVIDLAPDHYSGVVAGYMTEPFASNAATRLPTTIAKFGDSLYAVTAGFAPPAPDFLVRLPR